MRFLNLGFEISGFRYEVPGLGYVKRLSDGSIFSSFGPKAGITIHLQTQGKVLGIEGLGVF